MASTMAILALPKSSPITDTTAIVLKILSIIVINKLYPYWQPYFLGCDHTLFIVYTLVMLIVSVWL